jgi:hypothetical protein
VTGEITITNPNDWEDITLDSLDDVLDVSGACTIDEDGPYVIPMSDSLTVGYTCDPADLDDTLNTATAKWDADTYHTPTGEASGTADVEFTETLIDDCVDVSDTRKTLDPSHFCVTRNEAGELEGTDVKISYDLTFNGPAAGTCQDYSNTASFADNSTPQQTGEATATVRVCSYNALTIGYWKTHLGPNGSCPRGLPQGTGCSANGPWASSKLPISLGGYSVSSIQLAAAVFAANNCSNASASDNNAVGCLAAQLLAAKLNVATFGGSCSAIADGDAFLTSIGYTGPSGNYSSITDAQRAQAIAIKTVLDHYNNGLGCA